MPFSPRPGPRNLIDDVPGLAVGQAEDGALRTGVTVLLPAAPCPAGADVRGGGPGVREVHALDAENLVGAAHAVTLSGGSALGLGGGDAVAAALSAMGRGLEMGPDHPAVPIVPGAILYDLGPHSAAAYAKDGPPHPALARAALEAALAVEARGPGAGGFALGSHGAGCGAKAGAVKGGIGSASLEIAPGLFVGAIVAANPVGSVRMSPDGPFWAWPWEIGGEFGGLRPGPDWAGDPAPLPADMKLRFDAATLFEDAAAPEGPGVGPGVGGNTAIGAVAVNADLTAAECKRVAMMAQDGLARAIRPAHTPFDGDTIFALAPGEGAHRVSIGEGRIRAARLAAIGSAAADCVARAVARGVWEAESAPGEPPAMRV
ncbi:P1 family peptidase [Rhodovulum sp. DZ06]|uniref:P1 family peptidase n=1 Tax=Rhodovulum sp. DZ06 TaxID=3425126 RepID=UPI003D3595D7